MLACCSLMLCAEASAQSASRIGEYSYDRGVYRRVTDEVINQTLNASASVTDTVTGAQQFLNHNATFGAWRTSNNASGIASTGLGFQLQGPFVSQLNIHSQANMPQSQWLGFRAGPFAIDEIYAGAGLMYSEYSGQPIYGAPMSPGMSDDDNWAAVIWAQVRATVYMTDRFALSFTPAIYYLPLQGDVGWSLGFPFLGMAGITQPNALLTTGFKIPVNETIQFVMMDQFQVFHPQLSLMRNSPSYWANLGDTSPMDIAGRYRFGGFGPYEIDARGNDSFALNDRFMDADQVLLMNRATFSLMGRHGSEIYTQLFYDRLDYWDHNFDAHQSWQSGGFQIVQQGPSFTPYARYEFTAGDHWQTNYHYGVVGFQKKVSPDLVGYAEGGWLWSSIERVGSSDSWVALAGIRHRLGPYTWHGVDGGRAPIANFRNRYLATYGQYYITQTLGANSQFILFVQKADLDVLGGGGALERDFLSVGGILNVNLSPKSVVNATVSYEDSDADTIGRSWDMWTYRVSYMRRLGASMNATCFYQYQHAASSTSMDDDFSEHLLYMGVVKHF